MNTTLIVAWMIFIAVFLLITGLDHLRVDSYNSKLNYNFNLNGKTIHAIRNKAGATFMGYYPEAKISGLALKLMWAGQPWGLTAQSYIGVQFSLLIFTAIIGLNLTIFHVPIIASLILSVLLFFSPNLFLNEKIKKRKKAIGNDIPNMVGLLSTSIKAGVELIPSLQAISLSMPGALGDELRKVWTETATGKQLSKALNDMALRAGVDILKSFVETIITAQERGGSDLSDTLSDFSLTVLESQKRKAQEAAKKIPTKMLLPMFLCIFTPMLILLLAPVAFTLSSALE